MLISAARRARGLVFYLLAPWLLLALLAATAAAAETSFASARAGPMTVVHATGHTGFARAVAELALAAHQRIREDFSLERRMEATLLLLGPNSPAATREEWARRLPSWIAGVAFPARRLIVVRVRPGQTPRDLEPLLAHELTHVILQEDYATYDDWPLWFQEGLALRESRTDGLRDHLRLSAAALFDGLLPFESLRARFPADESSSRLAYAQSASLLAFLDARFGRARFRELMRGLRGGEFEETFRSTYGLGTGAAEGLWLRWATRRYAWLPAITSETAFWSLIVLLFLVAIAARRRRSRLLRERWEAEEREGPPEL